MIDSQIVIAIRSGGIERERAWEHLYKDPKLRQDVWKKLLSIGAKPEQIRDVYMDSLLIFEDQVLRKEKEILQIRGYIVNICRNRWLSRKKRGIQIDYGQTPETMEATLPGDELTPSEQLVEGEEREREERKMKILNLEVSKLDQDCRKALDMWATGDPMEAIRSALNYKGRQSAANKTHRCREKLRKLLLQNPDFEEFFNEYKVWKIVSLK